MSDPDPRAFLHPRPVNQQAREELLGWVEDWAARHGLGLDDRAPLLMESFSLTLLRIAGGEASPGTRPAETPVPATPG